MEKKILYLGDTALKEAACYLAGVMTYYKIDFDYVPSDEKVSATLLDRQYGSMILSDYPAANFSRSQLELIANRVLDGLGLLMIGGWDSFTGLNHEYTDSVLKDILPVVMQPVDDRTNCAQPCLIEKNQNHEIIGDLPFDSCPPTIGGFNLLQAKSDSRTILSTRRFKVHRTEKGFHFSPYEKSDPLLVVGAYGQGRVAAFASDVAPHWVGGFVDWGDARVCARAENSVAIEVGSWYARFFANLVTWSAGSLFR